ncbi:lysine-sensitive aspartokinase 3 [Longimicrobium sp.]|uniref:lysine-sensitive aspartokinase 3 n=1 Tax=Longimicrobium sp. TaxID=2029185 RepID=UPI002E353065|nr:lysine-sensitive aspartokinase 3 [Longimicrobium sp.]HEX6037146.1 lysine-sensitive aspartokinase 3 [Longimicrobium sp.]
MRDENAATGAGAGPLVMKFGGTSVQNAEAIGRLSAIVRGHATRRPVVVVSALSKVTDELSALARLADGGEVTREMEGRVSALVDRHGREADRLARGEALDRVHAELAAALREIPLLLEMMAMHPGTRRPLRDELLSWGERLSSHIVAAALRTDGLPSRWVDARQCIRTSEEHGRAEPDLDATRAACRAALLPAVDAGEVPVTGGFIGAAANGATTTLGRGGSDFSATLVGASLDAAEIQIWTDVSGFMTADPRVVGAARSIPRLTYDEAAELAYFGAKVLHPRTLHPAVEGGIPVRVCNSMAPDSASTLIDAAGAGPGAAGIKAVAHKNGITIVRITSARMLGASGFLRAIFEAFDRYGIAVDVVATSEVSVSLTVDDTERLERAVRDLRALGQVDVEGGYAIVCVVGEALRTTPGIAARVFGAMSRINVALISQGASGINLTFAVHEHDAAPAVRLLHAECLQPGSN